MLRSILACLLFTGIAAADTPKSHQIKLNGHTFTLPVGFTIELAAGPPLVERPINADFDELGRLYVSDSSGSNEKVQIQLEKRPHRILRLESTKGDGKFDKRTVFADKMMFPEGVMYYAGSVYVGAPPSIWKLTDTDGDGVADQRVEWFKGKTLTGCANDLHGPYLGPDGWIYWCKGAFAQQTYERPGKKPFTTRAAHIFRARPDGTGIEPVMTGGMDNPVGLTWTPGGERIFSCTFLQRPGNGLRDGLIHAIYGGIYGKDHDVIYEHPWTSPHTMPVLTHMGAAAPSGLKRYESAVFGPEYQDNLFCCQFNKHKISRHILTPDGATFKSRDEDFLVSDNLDFHPTNVLEDADGSLLVVDTGGWYKLCCPTSQLVKPDMLGAIYRVRKTGAAKVEDPRGLKLDWKAMTPDDLARLLDDRRPAVQKRAIETLAQKGTSSLSVLQEVLTSARKAKSQSVLARRNAAWAATRISSSDAREMIRGSLSDPDPSVKQVATHSVSIWRDRKAEPALNEMWMNELPMNRKTNFQLLRATAEAIGRLGEGADVGPLLFLLIGTELRESIDRVLEHSIVYALIEINDRETLQEMSKNSDHPSMKRPALIAMDQLGDGKLQVSLVKSELTSSNPDLKETAWWIASHHPEWGGELADFLRERLNANLSDAERYELASHLVHFAKSTSIQAMLADGLKNAATTVESKRLILRIMMGSGLKECPESWATALTPLLKIHDSPLLRNAIVTALGLRLPKQKKDFHLSFMTALSQIGNDPKLQDEVRLLALSALHGLNEVSAAQFAFLHGSLSLDKPTEIRSRAADIFAEAKLSNEQLLALVPALQHASPMEIDQLLAAFQQSTDAKVGERLITALKNPKVRPSLRVDMVKPRLAKYPASVQKQADELYAALNVDAAKQAAKLDELLPLVKDGDIRRGQAVFMSTKASCSACHAIGYLGGQIGPDLTRIGGIRSERDLLESIVFPSASFVRSYEPVLVTTKNGKVYNGLIRKDTPTELGLALGLNQEVTLTKSDVEDIQPSKVSIMPAGLDQQLTPKELADLVAFLKACK